MEAANFGDRVGSGTDPSPRILNTKLKSGDWLHRAQLDTAPVLTSMAFAWW